MAEILEPCPFCGGEVELKCAVADWYIDCPTCERHHWEADIPCKYPGKSGLIEWWNTRYKRTCKREIVDGTSIRYGVCSECKSIIDASDAFCRRCGAEVADGD